MKEKIFSFNFFENLRSFLARKGLSAAVGGNSSVKKKMNIFYGLQKVGESLKMRKGFVQIIFFEDNDFLSIYCFLCDKSSYHIAFLNEFIAKILTFAKTSFLGIFRHSCEFLASVTISGYNYE